MTFELKSIFTKSFGFDVAYLNFTINIFKYQSSCNWWDVCDRWSGERGRRKWRCRAAGGEMDHAVKAMSGRGWWARLVARRRFESAELEELYARYACKLQRASVGSALALWALLAAALAAADATRGWTNAPQVQCLTNFKLQTLLFADDCYRSPQPVVKSVVVLRTYFASCRYLILCSA